MGSAEFGDGVETPFPEFYIIQSHNSERPLEPFDPQGRRLHRIVQRLSAGRQSLDWDRRTDTGSRVGAGVYLVRLSASGQQTARSIVVL